MCIQFAQLNKGNLVTVRILIQSFWDGDPGYYVQNKLAGNAVLADPGSLFE